MKKLYRRSWIVTLIALIVSIILVASCAQPAPAPTPAKPAPTTPAATEKPVAKLPASIIISGGSTGTGLYTVITGIATVSSKYLGIKAVPEPQSSGKVLILLKDKEIDFGNSFSNMTFEAARGLGDYKKYGKIPLRQVWSGANSPYVFVVRADSGIKSVTELKGKKVMGIYPANPAFTQACDLILEGVGMTRNDIVDLEFSGNAESVPALKEKRIDAFIHAMPSLGLPAFLQQLNTEVPARVISAPEAAIDKLVAKYNFAGKGILDAKTYKDMSSNQDLPTISFTHVLLTHPAVSEDLVYGFVKSIFTHLDELYVFHAEAKGYTGAPLAVSVAPYHEGAIKYWKEAKLWTNELEAIQKQLSNDVK